MMTLKNLKKKTLFTLALIQFLTPLLVQAKVNLNEPLALMPETPSADSFPKKGWDEYYSEFLYARLVQYPTLLNLPKEHVGKLCSNWENLNQENRMFFWVNLIKSISFAESHWNRGVMSKETAQNLTYDPRTKTAVYSQGLLQMSYGSIGDYAKIYQSDSCNIPYNGNEKKQFKNDILSYEAKGIQISSHQNERKILHPLQNLACGLDVMYLGYLIKKSNTSETLRKGIARYWSSMRLNSPGFKTFMHVFAQENQKAEQPCVFEYSTAKPKKKNASTKTIEKS